MAPELEAESAQDPDLQLIESIHIQDANIPEECDTQAAEPYYLDLESQVVPSLWRDYREQDPADQ